MTPLEMLDRLIIVLFVALTVMVLVSGSVAQEQTPFLGFNPAVVGDGSLSSDMIQHIAEVKPIAAEIIFRLLKGG